ncbi:unnamed protein product [Ectocarpus sp. 4 AP-2014]
MCACVQYRLGICAFARSAKCPPPNSSTTSSVVACDRRVFPPPGKRAQNVRIPTAPEAKKNKMKYSTLVEVLLHVSPLHSFTINHGIYLVNKHKQRQHYNSSKDNTLRGHHPMRSNRQPRQNVPNIPPPQLQKPAYTYTTNVHEGTPKKNTFRNKRVRAP